MSFSGAEHLFSQVGTMLHRLDEICKIESDAEPFGPIVGRDVNTGWRQYLFTLI
jgi:hypothetical protein